MGAQLPPLPLDENSIANYFPEPPAPPEPLVSHATREMWQHSADLEALFNASATLGSTLEWDALLKQILTTALQLVKGNSGSIMLLDQTQEKLVITASVNLPSDIVNQTHIRIGEGIVGLVAQNRQPLLLVGPVYAADYPQSFPKPDKIASSICMPLVKSNSDIPPALLGVLNLSRGIGAPPLTPDDLRLISAFGAAAVVAIENSRAFQDVRRRAAQSQHLSELSREIIKSLDVEQVLQSIMHRAVELLYCESGSLFLVDEATGELVFKVVVGPASQKLVNTRLPAGVGIVGISAKEGKPSIVNNAKADPRHYSIIDNDTLLTTRSILCVPLIKDRVIGVLEVINKIDGTGFDEADCDMLTAFANQGALALANAQLYSEMRRSLADTVRIIANAVEARDTTTAGHTGRVTQFVQAVAQELGWSQDELDILEIGALLHDIGKIGVSDLILRKPENLTMEEYGEMKNHTVFGARMLTGVAALQPMLPYILYHHERYDGKGYPFGLKGDQIPIEGRLLTVADTFDAMTSRRPYRAGLTEEAAIAEIERNRGTQFDPVIVDALLAAHRKGKLIAILDPNQVVEPSPAELVE